MTYGQDFFEVASVVQILYYMFECSVFALLLLWLGLTGVEVWSRRVFSKPNLWPVQGSSSLLSCHQGVKTTTSSQDKGQRGGVGEKDLTVKGKRCKVIKGRTSLLMFAHLVSLSRDRICSPTAGCHWWRRRDSTCIHELWPTGKLFLFSLYFIFWCHQCRSHLSRFNFCTGLHKWALLVDNTNICQTADCICASFSTVLTNLFTH